MLQSSCSMCGTKCLYGRSSCQAATPSQRGQIGGSIKDPLNAMHCQALAWTALRSGALGKLAQERPADPGAGV